LDSLKQLKSQLQVTQSRLDRAAAIITAMQSSKFWQLRAKWFHLKQKLGLPTEPEIALDFTVPTIAATDSYTLWTERNFPRPLDLQRLKEVIDLFPFKPLLSVVVPVYNPPEAYLSEAIESVLNQIYPHWELCLADDASDHPEVKRVLQKYAEADSRIKVVFRSENGHIVQASNSALAQATGEFIITLDHDDLLTPDALYEIALLLNKRPDADIIYSDSDVISWDQTTGEYHPCNPAFKPDWCPDTFLSVMYTCHLGCYRRTLVEQMGGYRTGFEGSQDYDLMLRLTEKTDRVCHIPKILYHWRAHADSVASLDQDVKSYAYLAAEKALSEALERRGEPGEVTVVPNILGRYIIRYEITDYRPVSIIVTIPNQALQNPPGQDQSLERCLSSIFAKTSYPNYHVTLVSSQSTPLTQKWVTKEPDRLTHLLVDPAFNEAEARNYAVTQSDAAYLLFLNCQLEVMTPDWIQALVEQVQRPSIGAAGGLLLYPDRSIHHAGIVVGVDGIAANSHQNFPPDDLGWGGWIRIVNNYSAVSGDCLLCRRQVFEQSGGFNPSLTLQYSDVDLCLKFVQQGYRNVYLPHVVLTYYPSSNPGAESEAELALATEYMQKTWTQFLEADPCYNPNLSRSCADFSIGW
jgi:O-antigen biosynthesis protein